MHVVSTINRLSKSEGNIPVAVFCYQNQRRFLRVSESYEETIRLICKTFGIKNIDSVGLHTSSLDVCKGNAIQIDVSAYSLLWTVLDEINVVIEDLPLNEEEPPVPPSKAVPYANAEQLPSPSVTPVAGPSREVFPSHEALPPPEPEAEVVEEEEEEDMYGFEEPSEHGYPADEDEEFFTQPAEIPVERTVNESKSRGKFKAAETKNEPSPVKKEMITEAPPPMKAALSKRAATFRKVAASDEARFEITINGPLGEVAQFKTRGQHTVKKVLSAACKTFDVDVDRARLILSVAVEEADGDKHMHEFECPQEDTVGLCGISTTSELFVKVDTADFEDDDGWD